MTTIISRAFPHLKRVDTFHQPRSAPITVRMSTTTDSYFVRISALSGSISMAWATLAEGGFLNPFKRQLRIN